MRRYTGSEMERFNVHFRATKEAILPVERYLKTMNSGLLEMLL